MEVHYKTKCLVAALVVCQTDKNLIYYFPMAKQDAIQRIDSHEKLCRIMQKQTHDKILKLETQINRVESILLVSVGTLISGMAYVIFALIISQ
jgi:hypothetical protein